MDATSEIEQEEKKFIQSLLLREIFRVAQGKAIFKGGTALMMAFGLTRFSEDLDFDMDLENLTEVDKALDNFGLHVGSILNDYESERLLRHTQAVYNIVALHPKIGKPAAVRIDVSFEKPATNPLLMVLQSRDGPFSAYIMSKEEILAEKIRAIYDEKRNKARDLYDLAFLLDLKTEIRQLLVFGKLQSIGKRYSLGTFTQRVAMLENDWEKDLGPLVKYLPKFAEISDKVIASFRHLNF